MAAAVDYFTARIDLLSGRLRNAKGTAELNQALATALTGLWAELEVDRARLLVDFELATPSEIRLPDGSRPVLLGG
jgi:hypothetical protein